MEEMMTGALFFKAGASLLFVVGLMVLLVYALKILQGKKRAMTPRLDRIHVAQVHHVNSKQKLLVVQWNGRESLIALTPNGGFLMDQKDMSTSEKQEKQDEKHDVS